jgi:hypothetical protein
MRTRLLIAAGVIAAAAMGVSGCLSERNASTHAAQGNPMSPITATAAMPDSHPGPPPPPPKPNNPGLSVQFAGADSASAGQTAVTRWQFGNTTHSSTIANWTLTGDAGWSGLPQEGTVSLAPLSTKLVSVSVAVPDSTPPGSYPIHMNATTQQQKTATADGAVQVAGGADSTRAR